jgi:hypothetical protein
VIPPRYFPSDLGAGSAVEQRGEPFGGLPAHAGVDMLVDGEGDVSRAGFDGGSQST